MYWALESFFVSVIQRAISADFPEKPSLEKHYMATKKKTAGSESLEKPNTTLTTTRGRRRKNSDAMTEDPGAQVPLSMSPEILGEGMVALNGAAKKTPVIKRKRGLKGTTVINDVLAKAPAPEIRPIASIDREVGASVPIATAEAKLEKDLETRPAGTLQASMRIFQIYFENWQRELLDPAFIALDNSKSTSELYEFDVFVRLAQSEYVKGADLWGALSWRFMEKTGMSGVELVKYIESQPGFDVYFSNPVPENEALYHNLWLQGEIAHPDFLGLVQAIIQVTGLPAEELIGIQSSDKISAANYFVGTANFWAAYLPWVSAVLALANKKLPPEIRDLLHSTQADDRGLHGGASYVPFIVERLFPIFMKTQGKSLKGCKVPLPERDRELNVHLKLLREMKDVAHRTKSTWLAACWINYRNLYLTQMRGKEWCSKYLRAITPKDIRFS